MKLKTCRARRPDDIVTHRLDGEITLDQKCTSTVVPDGLYQRPEALCRRDIDAANGQAETACS